MTGFLKRHWPLVGLGVVLSVVALYLGRAAKEIIQEPLLKEILSGEGLKLSDIHYTHDDPDDKVRWILDAKEVRFSGDRQVITFRTFQLRLEPEGRPVVEVKGDEGQYSRESGEIRVKGNLRGRSENGYQVFTESLVYKEKEGRIHTDDPVKIVGPFFSMTGRGLLVDLKGETLKIFSDATTVIERTLLI
jgi:LPS export ABC transporter protein LptC